MALLPPVAELILIIHVQSEKRQIEPSSPRNLNNSRISFHFATSRLSQHINKMPGVTSLPSAVSEILSQKLPRRSRRSSSIITSREHAFASQRPATPIDSLANLTKIKCVFFIFATTNNNEILNLF